MDFVRRLIVLTILFAFLYFLFPLVAYAYIDPGTGSFFLQLFIASVIGAFFAIKIYWMKVKTFFVGLISEKGKEDREQNGD